MTPQTKPPTVTLVLNVTAHHRHEHGIDTFFVHVTPELAAQLLALCEATRAAGAGPAVAPHLGQRQVAALVLAEPADAPGAFATPSHKTREARKTRRLSEGVWATTHETATARPAAVSNRHLIVTPSSVWWSARASLKADELMTSPVTAETLNLIARGELTPPAPRT